ncbi:MAG: hypothetical protein P1S60_19745, partial [Anaerolineae bacterium]|nr:hypothetical protein [Anaerolineae bacterium]
GISIDGNRIQVLNTSGSRPAILVQPDTTPTSQGTAYIVSQNVITGTNAGIGIQVLTDCGTDVPNMAMIDNTVALFTRAVSLDNTVCPGGTITATVTGNTLAASSYGLFTNLAGAGNALTVHQNCIASNITGGISCGSTDTIIDATNNYWGHWTGPGHAKNPDGLGDRILCSDAAAEIDYAPWLETHPCYISGLKIANIEVVQSVQTISNTIPLVAGKGTVVRVYPDLGIGFSVVNGTLTGTRDGHSLGTVPASSPVYARTITDWDFARADESSSLIFTLPAEWVHGSVDLRVDVTTGTGSLMHKTAELIPCALGAETVSMTQTVSFNTRKPIKIAYIPTSIDTQTGTFPVTTRDILDVHAKILALFPFGSVDVRILPAINRYTNADTTSSIAGLYFAYISGVARRWDLINNPDNVADYYVTVYGTNSTNYTGAWFYFGDPGGQTSCGLRNAGQDCLISMGNQLGLRPLIFSKESAMPPYDYTFPYPDHRTHIFGYDTISPQILAVQAPDAFDIMSPEASDNLPSWISDFHYEKIYLNLAPAPETTSSSPHPSLAGSEAIQRDSSTSTGNYLYVNGLAGPTDGRFYPVIQLQ